MKRPIFPDEARLWAVVAATVRPAPGRVTARPRTGEGQSIAPAAPPPPPPPAKRAKVSAPVRPSLPPQADGRATPATASQVGRIEPGRERRIVRGRDPLDARLDLHGLDQDRARAALSAFLCRAQVDGVRAVLVITGKGALGDGVLRRRAPEWLADPALRAVVAGVSPAGRRHGGEGALYVALKRRSPTF